VTFALGSLRHYLSGRGPSLRRGSHMALFPNISITINGCTSPAAEDKAQLTLDTILRRITTMSETIDTLQAKLDANGTAITALQNTVDAVQDAAATAFAGLTTQIADLKAQLASGTPVSQAQLDALGATVDAQKAALDAVNQDVTDTPIPPVA